MGGLKIEGLSKSYRTQAEELRILRDINLEIAECSRIMITGESGSGKSTLLNIIGGLDRADSGLIDAGGLRITDMGETELSGYRSRMIGFIFQFHYLLKDFTAAENVMMPMYMAGARRKDARKRALELLKQVRMDERAEHYPVQLSGGERQRVALARALINDPEYILADEPTGNLDEDNSRMVEELLFSIAESRSKTLIMVTHDPALADRGDTRYHLTKGVLEKL